MEKRKIVINNAAGLFDLSDNAKQKYLRECDRVVAEEIENSFGEVGNIKRDDPILIKIVEEMGQEANAENCSLKVIEIPADIEWEIINDDGVEYVVQKDKVWS